MSIHVIGTNEVSPGRYLTKVGTDDTLSISIMEGIADREGSQLLALSKDEEQKLSNILGEKLNKIFQ